MLASIAFISYVVLGGAVRWLNDEVSDWREQARLELQDEVSECRFEPDGQVWRALVTASNSGSTTANYLVRYEVKGDSFSASGGRQVLDLAPDGERIVALWIGGSRLEDETTMTCDLEVVRITPDPAATARQESAEVDVSGCRIEDFGAVWVTVTNNSLDVDATYIIKFVVSRDGEPIETGFGGVTDVAPGATVDGALQVLNLDWPFDSLTCEIDEVTQAPSEGS